MLYSEKKLKSIREYMIKSFAFYYNNYCPIYQEAKYGINYWLQELKLDILKGIKEVN